VSDAPSRPITFTPLYMPRVWGGQRLSDEFGRTLPQGAVIGESWEVVDRHEAQSVVRDGPFAGLDLHDLWRDHRAEVFGEAALAVTAERFPLFVKLLDATDTLSVQVHPPADVAPGLGGETKNEMWFMAAAEPGAHIYAGLRTGVTRASFEAALAAGEDVSQMLHRIDVAAGDAIFIPAGRVHAIGGGCLIVEVQQNSDTTYRVFDFNRPGLDGKPRDLHVDASLASIDWDDFEPALEPPHVDPETVVATRYFEVDRWELTGPRQAAPASGFSLVCVLRGSVTCRDVTMGAGDVMLVPVSRDGAADLEPVGGEADVLVVTLPA
jgi:mannose-6-phosphate isomerase